MLRAHIATGPERNKGWLRAVFDPQSDHALGAIHDGVNTPWTVDPWPERRACLVPHSQHVLKSYSDKHPLEYVTEWRMQKAMQLLQQRDKKLIDVAQ